MGKGYGLVGNICIYGVGSLFAAYFVWEMIQVSKNLPRIDNDHPVNEIYEKMYESKLYASEQLQGRVIYDSEQIRFGKDTMERNPDKKNKKE